ncbi:hypothetical protein RchiOBHm_Chr2g0089831 [Rosa chinensis]|uniref:Secreted protein n=1 Tax=Rosa chinensis TaxID=74649 RepID=A0A2P6RJB6_ROSCH|nr:hypothetical protein RchiOBHm_Chr2g0089831 [Rosa chinensis]
MFNLAPLLAVLLVGVVFESDFESEGDAVEADNELEAEDGVVVAGESVVGDVVAELGSASLKIFASIWGIW